MSDHFDHAISTLADGQQGVITHRQLTEAGVDSDEILDRLSAGDLRSLHPGVYGVGDRPVTAQGRWTAAILSALQELGTEPTPPDLRAAIDAAKARRATRGTTAAA